MLIEFEGLAIAGKLAKGLAIATSTPSIVPTASTRVVASATTTTTSRATARLTMSLRMGLPPFVVRLKIGIKERLVGWLGAFTTVVAWFTAVEAGARLPGGNRCIEGRWARVFGPDAHGMHAMVGS